MISRYENPRLPTCCQNKPNQTPLIPSRLPLHLCPVRVFFLRDSNGGGKHTRYTLHALAPPSARPLPKGSHIFRPSP